MLIKNVILVSIDLSIDNLIKLRKKYKNNSNLFFVAADALNLPFKNDIFDIMIASEVIEHINEPYDFINHLVPLLNQTGKLIITTPYKEEVRYELCVNCNHPTPRNSHLHSFYEKKI